MKKLLSLIKWDLITQQKYGLFSAGFILSLVWIAILMFLPDKAITIALPIVLLGDLAVMGYMFIAAMVFFEKGQGSIFAVVTTPIKVKQYILAKIISLLIFITAVSVAVVYAVSIAKGVSVNLLFVLIAILLTALFYMLLGLFIATKYKDFTDFLFPSGVWLMALFIPMLGLLELPGLAFMNKLFYVFPSQGMLFLMKAMFSKVSSFNLIYAIGFNVVAIIVLFNLCVKEFNRKVIGRRRDINV